MKITEINWKQKLTSRKFWAAVAGLVTALLVLFGADDMTIAQVGGVVAAMGVLIAYIVGEGMVDAARIKKEGDKDEAQK